MYSIFVWLPLLSIIISRFIHDAACISCFNAKDFYTSWIYHNLFIHSSVARHFCCLGYYRWSSSEHACIVLRCGHMLSLFSGKYLGIQWLGHMVRGACLLSQETIKLFSKAAVLFCILTSYTWELFHILKNTWYFQVFRI